MARPVRERPRLLVDLSEKVSEDLRIDTPTTLTPLPRPQAIAGPRANTLKANTLSAGTLKAGILSAGRATPARRLEARKPSPLLARRIAGRISKMFPDDGEVIFAISHWCEARIGEAWRNECDYMFWIASEYQVIQAVYEWMNSEYEAISEQFGYDGTDPIELEGGRKVFPTLDELYEAWDAVANDQSETPVTLGVRDENGIPTDGVTMTAGEVMGHLGITRDDLIPYLILADSVLPEDHAALYGNQGDAEVYLDEGYIVTGIVSGEEYTCIHINPK